jgi:hypothetical protein
MGGLEPGTCRNYDEIELGDRTADAVGDTRAD